MDIETNQSTPEFDEFQAAGEVEVGKPAEPVQPEKKGGGSGRPPQVKQANEAPKTPAKNANLDDGEGDDDDQGGDDDDEGGEEENQRPRKTNAQQQIDRLKREKADLNRRLRALEGGAGSAELARRLENVEKGLAGANRGDNQNAAKAAPDPTDATKYPLGHLDDRYVEDKLVWLSEQRATKDADSALQRQQELERNEAASRQQQDILGKVDDLSAKGEALFDDFQETVVETGMRGDWDLQQPTFEACHEAENGAQILYDLSQDPKEARRVARLSPYQQMKFVQERDAELSNGTKPNRKPQAGAPPKNTARGANSKTQINPATDNLDDFERQWERDAKGK